MGVVVETSKPGSPSSTAQANGGESPFIQHKDRCTKYDEFKSYSGREVVNLVLCFDGTENEFGFQPFTNVLKLFKMLEKEEGEQLCYYQPGIGAKFHSQSDSIQDGHSFKSKFSKVSSKLDSMLAFTLADHVKAAYKFLMRFYYPGIHIHLFGFRGSFTARVLAGMIEKVGLLNSGLEEMVSTAWELYSNWEYAGQPAQQGDSVSLIDEFKDTFSRKKVQIHFMGLWDSVNSVGLIKDKLFPYTMRSSIVTHVRHAVSIDERRGKYKQVLFQPFSYYPNLFSLECCGNEEGDQNSDHTIPHRRGIRSLIARIKHTFVKASRANRNRDVYSEDVVEKWFPGSHSDIGGGWPPDFDGYHLSDISLRWMLLESIKFGVRFREGSIHNFDKECPVIESLFSCHHDVLALKRTQKCMHPKKIKIPHKKTLSSHRLDEETERLRSMLEDTPLKSDSKTGGGSRHAQCFLPSPRMDLPKYAIEKNDARGDVLLMVPILWWLIELLPVGIKLENDQGKWKRVNIPNLGRNRTIPKEAQFHWSLFYRLHYVDDYKPTNIPKNLGAKFKQLLCQFHSHLADDELDYTLLLTLEQIKNDWDSKLWKFIPDELSFYLRKYPNL